MNSEFDPKAYSENSWSLVCHPDHPADRVEAITVSQEWTESGQLWLRYHIDGEQSAISTPDPANGERRDNLWQTTCCELFVRIPGDEAYGEYNFSPSSQWAAYQFSAFRKDMANMEVPGVPEIYCDASETHLALETTLLLPERFEKHDLKASFSVVIEEVDGPKSFWAVTHPAGEPEFHHRDCFSADLKASKAL